MSEGSDCPTEKVQYTKAGARDAAALARKRGDGKLKPYHCQMCDCWHLGHRRRADKKQAMGGR